MADDFDITIYAASDVGCRREINEDSVLSVQPPDADERRRTGVLVIVADGMGGHSAGEVASRLAIDVVRRTYFGEGDGQPATLVEAFQAANRAVYDASEADARFGGMGTTCTAIVIKNGLAECAHVGDTRLYLVRQDQIYRMTEDHSVVREMVARGVITAAEAQRHADRNVILRAVGTHPTVDVTTWGQPFPCRAGDRFVVCSDGLHDLVEDDEIRDFVIGQPAQAACQAMVELAKTRGGYDNITVALLDIRRPGDSSAPGVVR
jgi:protein phosphatase